MIPDNVNNPSKFCDTEMGSLKVTLIYFSVELLVLTSTTWKLSADNEGILISLSCFIFAPIALPSKITLYVLSSLVLCRLSIEILYLTELTGVARTTASLEFFTLIIFTTSLASIGFEKPIIPSTLFHSSTSLLVGEYGDKSTLKLWLFT